MTSTRGATVWSPMPAPLAPALLVARLALAATLATLAAAVGVAGLVPLALGTEHAAAARTLAVGLAVGGAFLSVLLALDTQMRVRPIYRYFVRLSRSPDAAPPSDAALRDAFAAPMRLALIFVFGVGAIALVDALGVVQISGAPAGLPRVLLDLGAWLMVLLVASPLRSGVEWALEAWLARIDPAEIVVLSAHALAPRSLSDRVALRVAIPSGAATLLAAAGAAARAGSVTPLVAGLLATFGVGAFGYWLARRTARKTADELRAIAAYAESLAPGAAAVPMPAPRDASSAELHAALVALAERLASVRANEEHAHREMAEAQHLKTQFLASMSHDLRSPLNSILGFSEVLLGGLDGPLLEPQRESVRAIQRAGEDLLRLLTDVLDSARFEAGRLELRRAWTPLVEILTEAVRQGRIIAAERTELTGRALSIEVELQPGLPPVYVDSDRIVQVVVGLLGHAARAMDGGTIRVRARVGPSAPGVSAEVRVEVIDTGGGIPESERQRLFEAFRGARGGRRLAGLGLGLALARALARAHGGDVSAASAVDGTTFTVALPTDGPMPTGLAARKSPRPVRR